MLRVTERTLHNWITGRHAVPYSAFKLVRVLRRMDIPLPGWEGWTFCTGYLYSPEGHRFSGKDSAWWSLLVRRARMFSSVYDENMRLRQRLQALEAGASTVPLVPDFLAPAGREVHVTPHLSPLERNPDPKTSTPQAASFAPDFLPPAGLEVHVTPQLRLTSERNHQKTTPSCEAPDSMAGARKRSEDATPSNQAALQPTKATKGTKLACRARRTKRTVTVAPATPQNPDSSTCARLSRFLPRGAQ